MKKFENNKNEFLSFLELDRGYSVQTISAYRRDIELYQNFVQENKLNYLKAKKEIIFDFQSSLQDAVGPRSFARLLSALRTFYKFLHMENLINDIVFNEIKLYPSPKYKKSIPTFLSKNQIEEIIKKIDSDTKGNDSIKARNKALIMLFFTSGLRLNELNSIKIRDIDFSNNSLKVVGKGNKQRMANFDNYTKNLIIQYLTYFKKYPLVKKAYDDNLFVHKNNKALSRYNIQYIVMKNLKKLTLNTYGPHALRHSFATHLLNNGVGLNAIKSLLGHESLSSTQIYTHVGVSKLKEAIKKSHPRGEK